MPKLPADFVPPFRKFVSHDVQPMTDEQAKEFFTRYTNPANWTGYSDFRGNIAREGVMKIGGWIIDMKEGLKCYLMDDGMGRFTVRYAPSIAALRKHEHVGSRCKIFPFPTK